MPKTKTRRAAAKRFKLTGSGKLLRRPTMRSHNLEKKSPKQKRKFAKELPLEPGDERSVKKMLGLR
jgi:large subunit ribosomal protein L35